MDPNRFDRISRSLGQRLNRRQALGSLAVAGTALAAHPPALAAKGACTVQLTVSIRIGPNANQALSLTNPNLGEFSAVLSLPPVGSTAGSLAVGNNVTRPAIVESSGHRLDVRLNDILQGAMVLSGMASLPVAQCSGVIDGLFTGPAHGDIGDWHGVLGGVTVAGGGSKTESSVTDSSTDPSTAPTALPTAPAACGMAGAVCQADTECCETLSCVQGYCDCKKYGQRCDEAAGDYCCYPITCAVRPGESEAVCCLPLGSEGCDEDNQCCEGYCFNGLCAYAAPEPCGQPGEPCNNEGVCCGNAYCDLQDPPGTCICAQPGEPCIPVGNGACCSGDACNSDGVCP